MDTTIDSISLVYEDQLDAVLPPFATLQPEPVAFELIPIGDSKQTPRRFERKISPMVTVRRCVDHYIPDDSEYPSSCPVVSRTHAQLKFTVAAVVVIDCGSHHGTWVTSANGQTTRLVPTTPHVLQDGDLIQFGKSVTKGGQQHEPHLVRVKLLTASDLPPSTQKASSGRYGLLSDDELEVPDIWRASSSPVHYEELDSNMDEDEDSTSVEIKVYDDPPVQKEDTTIHEDVVKLENQVSRVEKELAKLKPIYSAKRRTKAQGSLSGKVNILNSRIDGMASDLKKLLEREADVITLREQVEALVSTTRTDLENLRDTLEGLNDELHAIRRERMAEALVLAEADEEMGKKRKRDDNDSDDDEELPPAKRSRTFFMSNSLACVAVGGLMMWTGLAFA